LLTNGGGVPERDRARKVNRIMFDNKDVIKAE